MISSVELHMFLDFAHAYFGKALYIILVIIYTYNYTHNMYMCEYIINVEYMAKACFTAMPSVLCKIFGVYKVGYHDKVTDKKVCIYMHICIYSDKFLSVISVDNDQSYF